MDAICVIVKNIMQLASMVEVFDFEAELWEKKTTSGTPPPGLYNTAYTTIGRPASIHHLYTRTCTCMHAQTCNVYVPTLLFEKGAINVHVCTF